MSLKKNMAIVMKIRTIILLVFVIVAVYFLVSPMVFKRTGVIVTSVDNESKCNVKKGDIITEVSNVIVKNRDDFIQAISSAKAGEYITMRVNGGPGGCVAIRDGYVGINVTDIPSRQLKFGIDIQGGTTLTLKPGRELTEDEMRKTVEILEKRIQVFNLPDTSLSSDGVVNISTIWPEKISLLTGVGKFEAAILEEIKLQNSSGKITIGDTSYQIKLIDSNLTINDSTYKINDDFLIDNTEVKIKNITNDSVIFEVKIFENKDIVKVFSKGSVSYNPNARVYEFMIPVEISDSASDRFTKVVKNMPKTVLGNRIIVNGFLVYYLDDELISRLNIPFELAYQKVKQINIIGFSESSSDASSTKLKVLSAIESEILPASLEIVGTKEYKPRLREFSIGLFAGVYVVTLAFVFYVHWKYRMVKSIAFIVLLASTEIFIIIGIIAAVQQLIESSWIVDFKTISGLSTVVIISCIQMTLTTKSTIKRMKLTIRKISVQTAINLAVLLVGFVILFTPWKLFGLTLLTGFIINFLLTKPLYEKLIKS